MRHTVQYNNDTLPSFKFESSGPPLDSFRVDLNSSKCCNLSNGDFHFESPILYAFAIFLDYL